MKKRIKILVISLAVIIVLMLTIAKIKHVTPLSWRHNEVNQAMFSDQAINGYDAVAYFTQNKAIIGNEIYSFQWKNAEWRFASEENKIMFVENPGKYAPQFGGYCSFAVSKGFTANTKPNSFAIINEKLYLFADNNMKSNWNENQKENLLKCESNWN